MTTQTPQPSTVAASIVSIPPPRNRVRLELDMSLGDARGLYDMCGHITGSSIGSPRRLTDRIYYALQAHPEVRREPSLLNTPMRAFFNDYNSASHE